ncbi:hypothetical protein IEQ34_010759 [Dendrobium chrysotoxum]|uniref:Uncharacterized protein n=1 Tax=Dendrobium chrysotoxum TaxID=161865 RepID=A0AAV7GTN9_DENCH|nr:hypothetical protein IEQ34_010759 [Dendrobium chrysotoxum]
MSVSGYGSEEVHRLAKWNRRRQRGDILVPSMRAWISCSVSSAPTLLKPSFSSSNVMVPLLSVSIILNNSFSPPISSSDRRSAMT